MDEYIPRKAVTDNYIKRDDALSVVNEPWDKNCGVSRIEYVRIRFANLPSADVVDKTAYDQLLAENAKLKKQVSALHGEWIRYGAEKWYCSNCEYTIECEQCSLPHFCQDCGANMKS